MHVEDLITQETYEYVVPGAHDALLVVMTVGVTNVDKANKVMVDIEGQLGASCDEKQYLTKVCNVLSHQGGAMKLINVMLKELGM